MAHNATAVESRLPSMPRRGADLDQVWAYLTLAANYIMAGVNLSPADYMSFYTAIYNYCKPTDAPFRARMDAGSHDKPNMLGSDLYEKLCNYFPQHIQSVIEQSEALQDVDLLRYYVGKWDRYNIGAGLLDRAFAYFNRHWIKHERDEGKKGVYPVHKLALVQWKTHFFSHIQEDNTKLTNAVVGLIDQERNGEQIDQDLIKKVVDSFVSLGLDKFDLSKECLDVYRSEFEVPLLQATENYYNSESEAFLAGNSVSDYLKKVEERLREEEARAERYLHATTHEVLVKKCEHILIQAHSEMMWESFQSLLDSGKDEDLQRMCALLSRVPQSLEPLHERFEAHVKQAGLAAISKLVGECVANAESLDPKAYVDALFEVHHKSSETMRRCFGDGAGFTASLGKACRELVNHNAVTGSSSTKSSEVIAKYADTLLREGKVVEKDDTEGALNRIMVLREYLEDKDALERVFGVDQNLSRPM